MRVLLSTIGSRGDVQPLVALALQLKALALDVHLCAPPDFRTWLEGLGLSVTTIGPALRATGKESGSAAPPSPEARRQLVEASARDQFETLATAAQGCDAIVGATALQIAAPSVAEKLALPYVFVALCPAVLPSVHHAPPVLGQLGDAARPAPREYAALWTQDAARFNALFGPALNAQRTCLGLAEVADVRSHIFTSRPWLAADPTLAPWTGGDDGAVRQTGAWILPDATPLGPRLESFLRAGDAPLYLGFGSIRAPADLSSATLQAARELGRRLVVARGWAELALPDDAEDCLLIDEVNQQALFPRVAAVIHHGGAGTTTAAARAGVPQVVVPQMYDQHYWAARVEALGLGMAHAPERPTAGSLKGALEQALKPEVVARARQLAGAVREGGARAAALALRELVTNARTAG